MTQPNFKLWKRIKKEFGLTNSEEEIQQFWEAYEELCAETIDPALERKYPRLSKTHDSRPISVENRGGIEDG